MFYTLTKRKTKAKKIAQENLINETLQKLHAKNIGVFVDPNQVDEVLSNFLSVRNLTIENLSKKLREFGSSLNELKAYLKASVLIRNIINNSFYSRMSPDDFDFSLFRPAASISIPSQINISEIVIPFSIRGKNNTIKLGERIYKDLKDGKSFEKLARRFSQTKSAKDGGKIGFVSIETLPVGLKDILINLKSGMNSELIITTNSVMIFKVNSWKNSEKIQRPLSEVSYAIVSKLDKVNNCKSLKKELIKGPLREDKISKKLRNTLEQLRPSEKITYTNKDGEVEVILCSRRWLLSDNSVKIIQGQMLEKKLSKLAEGLNLELQRTAIIHYVK